MEKIHVGLFNYQVSGTTREREQMAAQELEQKLDDISRCYHSPYAVEDMSAARASVAEKYGVTIRAVV